MWPWKLEIALLFGIQVPPKESMRKTMSPPFFGAPASQAAGSAVIATRAAANPLISTRRRERVSKAKREFILSAIRSK